MALVRLVAGDTDVESVGLLDVPPDGLRPLDPLVVADVVLDGNGVVAGLAKDQQIVGEGGPGASAVTVLSGERKGVGLGSDGLGLGVLVHGNLAVKPPSVVDVGADHIASEVGQAGVSMRNLRGGDLLDVDAGESTGLREP